MLRECLHLSYVHLSNLGLEIPHICPIETCTGFSAQHPPTAKPDTRSCTKIRGSCYTSFIGLLPNGNK
ncbi:hypothetical protein PDIG_40930 [Penicillium digitatum PHI26]|uniref:Uncharacterized protein n=2 Tax=Penicillium digitatum TaxID=36651 RepID=K9GDG9_PEND2|nr:hypothetical protein PDIP_85850 [Penicillium digitatum Pd1]EKV04791.1 hypothetical protein PDIP_85850 [Penicillium digitatum Pd1]EKV12823.1 hypothetical protein PDIG_40930 [Penicillium digitatum PHI26]